MANNNDNTPHESLSTLCLVMDLFTPAVHWLIVDHVIRRCQAQARCCACRNARALREQLTERLIARACAEMSPLSLSYNRLIVSPS